MSIRGKRLGLDAIAIFVGWAGSVLVGVWVASAYQASAAATAEHSTKQIDDHEARLRLLETCCIDARSDSKWIRESLQRIEKAVK